MSTNTDQEKRNAINTATINFYKSVRNNVISKVIDVIETAGSSAATEITEPEEMTIILSTSSITVQQDVPKTITVFVTCEHSYTLVTSVNWYSRSGNNITFCPSPSVSADTYTVTITATDTVTEQKASTTLTVVVQKSAAGTTVPILD